MNVGEQAYPFKQRKRSADAVFAFRVLMEKVRRSFTLSLDLEKAYDNRALREEPWYFWVEGGFTSAVVFELICNSILFI